MARLRAVVEMGVVGETPIDQAQRILEDSKQALAFDYAELGQQLPDGEYSRLCAIGSGAEHLPAGIGAYGMRREKPQMVFDALHDEMANDPAVRALGLRSVLYWPFAWNGSRCVLTIAWTVPRDEFVSEDEIHYLDMLAALVSRLLEVMERERRIAARADTDLLTGIPNRAALLEYLNREISAAERGSSRLAVLYIDLNNFKKVNDQYGHAAGDTALRAIALRIQSVLRKHELCARVGGDEFCVVVSAFKEDDELGFIARRILDSLREPLVQDGITLNASASVGIAVHPRDGTTIDDLLAHADRAMYRAKRERAAAYAFHASAATTVERPLTMDQTTFLSQFMMCYQPIISARSGRPIAAEVLPRWLQPEGMRSPQAFLQAARDQSVLPQLEAMIARAVAEKASEVRNIADIAYHINISEPGELLVDALPNHAPSFAIEVTEAQVAAEPFRYIAFAEVCRSRGQRFGVSDFGSDHLSLRTLTELRPDFVKVRVGRSEADREALAMLIEQAHRLSCYVIGEAIETAVERQWLVANGVDALQGFEICSPLAEQDFFAWLRRYRFAAAR
ncbi:MAG TPA: diguanylate cyclase [Candidatus Baltobacteraceae bacterium]|nr:diguanylate cyclase [Candidatus Baltobacteraceae bacterium]